MTDPERDRESTPYKVGNLQFLLCTQQQNNTSNPVIPNQVTIFPLLLSLFPLSLTHTLPPWSTWVVTDQRENSITLQNYSTRGARNRSRLSFSVHFSSTGWRSRRGNLIGSSANPFGFPAHYYERGWTWTEWKNTRKGEVCFYFSSQ